MASEEEVFNNIFGSAGNAASEDDVAIDPVALESSDGPGKLGQNDSSQHYEYPYPTNFDKVPADEGGTENPESMHVDENGADSASVPQAATTIGRVQEKSGQDGSEMNTSGMVIPITQIEKEQAAKDEQGSQHGPRIDPMLLRFMGIENRNDLGTNLMDLDMDSLPQKPWRDDGADITDWFNYGFTEDTWRAYCAIQVKMRIHLKRTANPQEVMAKQQQLLKQVGMQNSGGGGDKRISDRRSGVCFDFQNKGFCARGASCRWAHLEKSESSKYAAPPGVCFDFQNKGYCSWGSGCRWKHVDKTGNEQERPHRNFGPRGDRSGSRSRSRTRSGSRGRRRRDDDGRNRRSGDEQGDGTVAAPVTPGLDSKFAGHLGGILPGAVVPPHFRNLMVPGGRLLVPGVIPGMAGAAAGNPGMPSAPNMPLPGLNALPGMRQMALQQMLANNPGMQEMVSQANEASRASEKERHRRHRHDKDRSKDERRKRRHERDSDKKHRDRDRKGKKRSRSPRSRSRSRSRDDRKRHKKSSKNEKKSSS